MQGFKVIAGLDKQPLLEPVIPTSATSCSLNLTLWDQHELAQVIGRGLFGDSYPVRCGWSWMRGEWKAAAIKMTRCVDTCTVEIVKDPDLRGRLPDYKLVWNIQTGTFELTFMDYSHRGGIYHFLAEPVGYESETSENSSEVTYEVTREKYKARPSKAGSYLNMKRLANAIIGHLQIA